ncbi:hypothetical protein VTI28DRAFT_207 [Corynascus sepedonium]
MLGKQLGTTSKAQLSRLFAPASPAQASTSLEMFTPINMPSCCPLGEAKPSGAPQRPPVLSDRSPRWKSHQNRPCCDRGTLSSADSSPGSANSTSSARSAGFLSAWAA